MNKLCESTTTLIVIHNGEENRVYITVNKGSNEPIKVEFEEGPSHSATYTEVELSVLQPFFHF